VVFLSYHIYILTLYMENVNKNRIFKTTVFIGKYF